MQNPFPTLTPEEAAALIQDKDIIGFGGFTAAGACKVIPTAIAVKAKAEHAAGRPFKLGVITGWENGRPTFDPYQVVSEAQAWELLDELEAGSLKDAQASISAACALG